ncbi:tetratricopeptide repeat protein 32-like [Haliotis cracherodii]|uniref:tetratricopeptide repeat protein 32-like n=1 Tax=Haliotis rufescens TaxID=6454 RepID=UPI001EB05086|nr:tetratricopeptide repeat protein 32-like [Haliotis rufescens]
MRTEELFEEAEKLERLGKRDEALQFYTQFIEDASIRLKNLNDQNERSALQKKLGLAYNNRGFILYQKVEFDEAINDYTRGLGCDQHMSFTFYNRGLIHYRLGRFDEAISDMKQALSIEPEFESAQICLKQSMEDLNKRKTNIHT